MSTETNTNGANTAPNAPVQSANAAPAAASNAPQVDHAKEPDQDPAWLGKRLERERKKAAQEAEKEARAKALTELGIDDPEKVKKLLDEQRKRDEAAKSQEQKIAEYQLREQQREARVKELEEAVKLDTAEQLTALTEEQRKAVVELAGEDPAKQRKAIATLRPTWVKPASTTQEQQTTNSTSVVPSVQQQNQTQASVVPPKPATATAPPANAPPPAGSTVVPNHLETYNAMKEPGSPNYAPFAAAAYYRRYSDEIVAAQKARNAN